MVKIYSNKEISEATESEYRQYFAGHLSRSQVLDAIDDNVEIGISYYKSFAADKPHIHPVCSEYCYILSGATKILIIDTNEEYTLNKGDFLHISKGTSYASKHQSGTRVLFIKSPSSNDKKLVEISPELDKWLKTEI